MKIHRRVLVVMGYCVAALYLTLSFADDAQAYLDPGTGSIVLQVLAAGVFGLLFLLKTYWRKLLVLLGYRKPASLDDQIPQDQQEG
jgi:hypothetical protein